MSAEREREERARSSRSESANESRLSPFAACVLCARERARPIHSLSSLQSFSEQLGSNDESVLRAARQPARTHFLTCRRRGLFYNSVLCAVVKTSVMAWEWREFTRGSLLCCSFWRRGHGGGTPAPTCVTPQPLILVSRCLLTPQREPLSLWILGSPLLHYEQSTPCNYQFMKTALNIDLFWFFSNIQINDSLDLDINLFFYF